MNKKLYILMLLIMMPALAFSAQADPARGQDRMDRGVRVILAARAFRNARCAVADSIGDPVRLWVAQQEYLRARLELREANPENIVFVGNQVLQRYAERHGPDTWHPF